MCTVDVVDCQPAEVLRANISELEFVLGNYQDKRFGWVTENLKYFEKPEPATGAHQGIWEWTPTGMAA